MRGSWGVVGLALVATACGAFSSESSALWEGSPDSSFGGSGGDGAFGPEGGTLPDGSPAGDGVAPPPDAGGCRATTKGLDPGFGTAGVKLVPVQNAVATLTTRGDVLVAGVAPCEVGSNSSRTALYRVPGGGGAATLVRCFQPERERPEAIDADGTGIALATSYPDGGLSSARLRRLKVDDGANRADDFEARTAGWSTHPTSTSRVGGRDVFAVYRTRTGGTLDPAGEIWVEGRSMVSLGTSAAVAMRAGSTASGPALVRVLMAIQSPTAVTIHRDTLAVNALVPDTNFGPGGMRTLDLTNPSLGQYTSSSLALAGGSVALGVPVALTATVRWLDSPPGGERTLGPLGSANAQVAVASRCDGSLLVGYFDNSQASNKGRIARYPRPGTAIDRDPAFDVQLPSVPRYLLPASDDRVFVVRSEGNQTAVSVLGP